MRVTLPLIATAVFVGLDVVQSNLSQFSRYCGRVERDSHRLCMYSEYDALCNCNWLGMAKNFTKS